MLLWYTNSRFWNPELETVGSNFSESTPEPQHLSLLHSVSISTQQFRRWTNGGVTSISHVASIQELVEE